MFLGERGQASGGTEKSSCLSPMLGTEPARRRTNDQPRAKRFGHAEGAASCSTLRPMAAFFGFDRNTGQRKGPRPPPEPSELAPVRTVHCPIRRHRWRQSRPEPMVV